MTSNIKKKEHNRNDVCEGDNRTKIIPGMNTQANKFYHIIKMVSLDRLNLNYAHFKKIMKLQFLKYGKT